MDSYSCMDPHANADSYVYLDTYACEYIDKYSDSHSNSYADAYANSYTHSRRPAVHTGQLKVDESAQRL